MPKNEDGEFELILGNKQLLSMFFVIVILLGVFFVMGYIVGRNSTPITTAETTTRKTEAPPVVVNSPSSTAAPKAEAPPASAPEKTTAPVETAKVEPPKQEAPKAETKKAPVPEKTDQTKAVAARPGSDQPVPGATYLQLVATTKHDADAMVEVLRKNNFQAIDNEVADKPGLFRVLVGPVSPADYNKLKADLQAKGFEGNRAFKKQF